MTDPTSGPADRSERREANLAVLRAVFAAMAEGDADGAVAHYGADYVLELPFADPDTIKVVSGREVVLGYLRAAFGVFRFELLDVDVHPTEDPDLVVAEYRSQGRVLTSGADYANRYVGFWWFRDGEVIRTREYYNPVASQRSLAAEGPADHAG